ncbi:hypothetical protein ACWDKQ_11125 [Saccharopolyspora sp. NPDC000995]
MARETTAGRERDRARHLVDTRWGTPETARNRLAAHHSYVAAVDAARRAIDA